MGSKKDNVTLAREVIDGKWGNGEYRKQKLTDAGYDYKVVQQIVNYILEDRESSDLFLSLPVDESVEIVEKEHFNLLDVDLDLSKYDGIRINITGEE